MPESPKKPSLKKELFGVLFILFSGVGAGLALTLWLLFNYGPTGQYSAGQVLIDPEYLSSFSYEDATSRFHLKKAEFRYWDEKKGTWGAKPLDPEAYFDFFNRVKQERSIQTPTLELENAFQGNRDALLFWVEEEGAEEWQLFLTIDFSPKERVFRVSLREPKGAFAYFPYPQGWELQF